MMNKESFLLIPVGALIIFMSACSKTQKDRAITINGGTPNFELLEMIEQMAGSSVPDGDYWYDAISGAAGAMGSPCSGFLPAGLELADPLPAGNSGGGGQDNFWSSRYSFGNESDGSGYVKLPDGGYVGY